MLLKVIDPKTQTEKQIENSRKMDLLVCKCDSCDKEYSVKKRSKEDFQTDISLCGKCKRIKNNLEKWGTEWPSQTNEVKEKINDSLIEHFGSLEESNRVRLERRTKTNLEKYGVTVPAKTDKVKEKIKQTNLERYGVESVLSSKEAREKGKKTNLERYGTEIASQSAEVKEKIRQTNLKRYGVESPLSSKEIQEKIKQTNLERHGYEFPAGSDSFKEKTKKTFLKKYGVDNPSKDPEIRKRINNTLASAEVQQKIYNTKKRNNSFHTSKPEEEIYKKLSVKFSDVKRQHKEGRYPFACDFYIPSEDLFIEYNGLWTHGDMPFDSDNEIHTNRLNEQTEKSADSNFYKIAIKVWTVADPKKRKTAEENNLNFLEFFSIKEFDNWVTESFGDL